MVSADDLRPVVARCVALFVLVHACLLALSDDELNAYSKWAEVLTHAFALPAILRGTQMREQIIVATIVSVIYHSVRNFTDWNYDGVQRLDHAMSTALIATVFLKYFAHITHVLGVIVLMAGAAASFEFGNVLASAVTAAILVFIIAIPYFDVCAYHILRVVVSCLSLGGVAPKAEALEYTLRVRFRLLVAFGLQALSVVFYFVGDNVVRLRHWSHCLWHVFAYTCLYVLVDIISEKEPSQEPSKGSLANTIASRPSRPSRRAFSPVGTSVAAPRVGFRFH